MPKDMTDKETAEMKAVTKKMLTALLPAFGGLVDASRLHIAGDTDEAARIVDDVADLIVKTIQTANNERWFD